MADGRMQSAEDFSSLSKMLTNLNFGLDDQEDEAYLADIEVAIAAAVEEVKGDPKSICEVRSHSDWHC